MRRVDTTCTSILFLDLMETANYLPMAISTAAS
ncbi:hypothetical protein F441_08092 [Phytophthora nicotianae CJ01A1]|uniref:Uncharacterized protein n=1 Tax=Phytophthora nicotianae CJ01A1 TaxID=1317063 RepID=W2X3W1_PHYNI|nr:hypothetical protein F441_08092 [Phytophthora nicotianae CJ01A1]